MIPRQMLAPDSVLPVLSGDRPRALETIVSAFWDDPVERWLYPDPRVYAQNFTDFVQAFGGQAIDAGSAWSIGDFVAVALWLAPGMMPDADSIVAELSAHVPTDRHRDMFAALEQMDAAHPRFRHWYLPWFGVKRGHQGHGHGGRLLTHGLAIVDASGLPAYLETPNPRTVPFYERHGFAVSGATDAGDCPPLTFMLRAARTSPGPHC
jgi:GNAT superfamily N-acetyltransferase